MKNVIRQQANDKAQAEYDKYHVLAVNEASPVEQHFIETVAAVKQLESKNKKGTQ